DGGHNGLGPGLIFPGTAPSEGRPRPLAGFLNLEMNRSQALEDKVLVGVERPAGLSTLRVERIERRVRAFFAGEVVADSKRVLLVFEPRHLPVYYFPVADVRMDLLKPTPHTVDSGGSSETLRWDLEARGKKVDNAA